MNIFIRLTRSEYGLMFMNENIHLFFNIHSRGYQNLQVGRYSLIATWEDFHRTCGLNWKKIPYCIKIQ